jgi:hypothetical protein
MSRGAGEPTSLATPARATRRKYESSAWSRSRTGVDPPSPDDAFADRQRVGYRLRVGNPEGRFLVEQQAYLSESDGQIVWVRVLCAGFQPHPAPG